MQRCNSSNLPYQPAACTAQKTNTPQGYLFLCIKIGCRASGEILALKLNIYCDKSQYIQESRECANRPQSGRFVRERRIESNWMPTAFNLRKQTACAWSAVVVDQRFQFLPCHRQIVGQAVKTFIRCGLPPDKLPIEGDFIAGKVLAALHTVPCWHISPPPGWRGTACTRGLPHRRHKIPALRPARGDSGSHRTAVSRRIAVTDPNPRSAAPHGLYCRRNWRSPPPYRRRKAVLPI